MNKFISPPTNPTSGGSGPGVEAAPAKSFDIVDIKQYFHIVVKRIWLVALCFVVSLAVTVVMLVRQVPVYRSQTTLFVSKGLPVPQRVRQDEMDVVGDYMETQLSIIRSPWLIAKARERLNRPEEEIQQKLVRVWPEQGWRTAFLYIKVESLDPLFAKDFANAMADAYLSYKADERMDTSQSTVISLTQQANRLRDELKKAEERVLAFEKENSVVAIQERGNIAARYLASLSFQAAAHRTERMLLEAQQPFLVESSDEIVLSTLASPLVGLSQLPIAMMSGTTNNDEVATGPEALIERGVVSEPAWEKLKRQKAALEAQLADARTKFKDAHPSIQKTLQDIKEIDRALDLELQFALRQYYSSLEALSIKEKAIKRAELEWEDDALEVSRKSHEYANLQRDVNRLASLYDLLFNRLKEVDVSIGIEPETIRLMEPATANFSPITPRKLQSIFLAALIGLGIGLGLVFGLEYIDDSIRYPEEVERDLNLPFFGVVPAANWDVGDVRTHVLSNLDQKSGLAEAYRNVRSALLFSADKNKIKTIAVTSAVPREGKTTSCVNMAVSLAQAGLRVLIVDGDLRRGELHKFFSLEGGKGFADILAGQAKPESVIQRTGLPNLDVVATGPFPPNPAELILRGEFHGFIEYAKRSYDKIFIDCPPIMAVSEAGILASLADGVVMVVWAGQTSRKLSQLSVQVMRQRGANILGCVLNNLEFGRVGYYYYSTYYGYYNYDYRYEKTPDVKS